MERQTNCGGKDRRRACTIGIDVGGTNTDAVIYNCSRTYIMASVKIPTSHSDYEWPVGEALRRLLSAPGVNRKDIISLNISTTLSTNAILENRGAPVNLVLIGFAGYPRLVSEILAAIRPQSLLCARGGHNSWGDEKEPLDAEALANFAKEHHGELFAVSSIYAARNPRHETVAREILTAAGCGGVTCGNDLARSKLNAAKRTLTAYLNSSLMPLTEKLICGIERAAVQNQLEAPIMFLRSDSSLVSAGWCRNFPLETIFSGPAASVRGAQALSGNAADLTAADMGGTSTDMGVVEKGSAVYSDEGAVVGAYRTMIPSLDITTIALGGDSAVRTGAGGALTVGPQRALPLCRACEHPSCPAPVFQTLLSEAEKMHLPPEFVIISADQEHRLAPEIGNLTAAGRSAFHADDIMSRLASGGIPADKARAILEAGRRQGWVSDCMFTPTDALNAQNLAQVGCAEYSRRGGRLLSQLGFPDAARRVVDYVRGRLESEITAKSASFPKALRVYVGAPVKAFAACRADAGVLIPEAAAVAGAVGAAASSLKLSCSVSIVHSFSDETFAAFLPTETIVSKDYPALAEQAKKLLEQHLLRQAKQMGSSGVSIEISCRCFYLGRNESVSTLSSAVLEGKAFVHDAQ